MASRGVLEAVFTLVDVKKQSFLKLRAFFAKVPTDLSRVMQAEHGGLLSGLSLAEVFVL